MIQNVIIWILLQMETKIVLGDDACLTWASAEVCVDVGLRKENECPKFMGEGKRCPGIGEE